MLSPLYGHEINTANIDDIEAAYVTSHGKNNVPVAHAVSLPLQGPNMVKDNSIYAHFGYLANAASRRSYTSWLTCSVFFSFQT